MELEISPGVISPQKDQKKRANENQKTGFAKMAETVQKVSMENSILTKMGMFNSSLAAAAA